ncbi:MAG: hypothetical protein CND43_00905 [Flavobacteriales bacterium MED-G15]|nr:MAG: hypothetical protein CND43_00905 [Flavobacteriales bacterium MED-G15]|tara:strand:+ start:6641 stop:7393 length:753 start_codon:yes stop_codon:yes gene_type:complete
MKYLFLILSTSLVFAQKTMDPKLTEVWEPTPELVTPGDNQQPPSDAVVLFDGKNLSKWINAYTGKPADWTINSDGSLTVKPDGGIQTKDEFGSVQFHIEWRTPKEIKGEGQGRGNSGITFQRRFEIQILDSYKNPTYPNGQAASLYKQYIPLVNASRPPGVWQEYDIVFIEPEYDQDGKQIKAGTFTVFHNGVLVLNNVEILGTTEFRGNPKVGRDEISSYMPGKSLKKNIYIQDHGNPVSFRNIWLRRL